MKIYRILKHADGSVETFRPVKNRNGHYVLADCSVHQQHNLAENQIFVESEEALVVRIRQGFSCRMRGDLSGQRNLISAHEIIIEP